jgi:hypothetical protein
MAVVSTGNIFRGQTTLDTLRIFRSRSTYKKRFVCIPDQRRTQLASADAIFPVGPHERLYDLGPRENWKFILSQRFERYQITCLCTPASRIFTYFVVMMSISGLNSIRTRYDDSGEQDSSQCIYIFVLVVEVVVSATRHLHPNMATHFQVLLRNTAQRIFQFLQVALETDGCESRKAPLLVDKTSCPGGDRARILSPVENTVLCDIDHVFRIHN